MTETDLKLSDGRTLHCYDTGADDGDGRLAVFSAAASLRAATEGRAAKQRYEASAEFDPEMFTQEDHAALDGAWSWFGSVVGPALETEQGGPIDDDLAYVSPWGFDPVQVRAPILLMHGGRDRIAPSTHSEWLARRCPSAELRLCPGDGHISVLNSAEAALGWLRDRPG